MELEGEGAAGGSVEHNVAEVTVAKNEWTVHYVPLNACMHYWKQ